MDPAGRRARRTRMRRLALSFAALLLPLSLAACGSGDDGDNDVASDPGTTTAPPSESPEPSPSAESESPSATYEEFAPTDYTYTLVVQCFCIDANQPVAITVAGGEITEAVYAESAGAGTGGQIKPGDPAGESSRLTINDIIERANDPEVDKVEVDWPDGQDYPNRVSLDRAAGATDDEVVYLLADVQVA